jgi:hypothetical protein
MINPLAKIPLLSPCTAVNSFEIPKYGCDDKLRFYGYQLTKINLIEEKVKLKKEYLEESDPIIRSLIDMEYQELSTEIISIINELHNEAVKKAPPKPPFYQYNDCYNQYWSEYKIHDILTKYDMDVKKINDATTFNEEQRLKIVNALGGTEFCRKIPVINLRGMDTYLNLDENELNNGRFIVQFEDKAGRKGICMKLKRKDDGNVLLFVSHQKYREVCLGTINANNCNCGGFWVGRLGDDVIEGVDKLVMIIRDVMKGGHDLYEIVV